VQSALRQPDGSEFRFPPETMLHLDRGTDKGAGVAYKDVHAHYSALAAL
jgi:hypothetical protein